MNMKVLSMSLPVLCRQREWVPPVQKRCPQPGPCQVQPSTSTSHSYIHRSLLFTSAAAAGTATDTWTATLTMATGEPPVSTHPPQAPCYTTLYQPLVLGQKSHPATLNQRWTSVGWTPGRASLHGLHFYGSK